MTTTKAPQHYFVKHAHKLDVLTSGSSNMSLRTCQKGAYWAVWSHFTTSSEPSLISLPTGAGKTALMMALAFGLKATRCLVITPAAILRDQLEDEFSKLAILKQCGVIPTNLALPSVHSNKTKCSKEADWRAFESFDVVVATPKTTSPGEKDVCNPPNGLFDLVFVDEAHHTPAPTWAALVRTFRTAKTVFLTATPFRRDRRRIKAPLVYHYSIGRAIDDGIYRPIDFHAVAHDSNRANQDRLLCEATAALLTQEKAAGNQPKILVRTDNVGWSDRLVKLYQKNSVNVESVDYTKSLFENQATLQKIRDGKLDGMVCVGMVGEGLDIPELKIATLHSSPRSLPFTLQFIGRVSRTTSTQVGSAHLLAVPDEVRGEVRTLYRSDSSWAKIVPKLVDAIVGKVSGQKQFRSSSSIDAIDVDVNDIKPFFSVRVYRVQKKKGINLGSDLELADDVAVCLHDLSRSNCLLVVITEKEAEPPWAKDTAISDNVLALHIVYWDKGRSLLYESTTQEGIANMIRACVAPDCLSEIAPSTLMQVMDTATSGDYFMVGLKNALGKGVSQPTYKTLMGSQVQAAVRPVEGRTFAPGHALAKVSSEETRGIATGNNRIWAIQRGTVDEFTIWCDELGGQLAAKAQQNPGLPHLRFLARSKQISTLSGRPIGIMTDERLLFGKLTTTVSDVSDSQTTSSLPVITITDYAKQVLYCDMELDSAIAPIKLEYCAANTPQWRQTDPRQLRIRLELSDDDIVDNDFAAFSRRFPPTLVMPQGGVVVNDTLWTPDREDSVLPLQCLQAKNWTGCDISTEDGAAATGMTNVQDFTIDIASTLHPKDAVIITDHGSGEIADVIVVLTKLRRVLFIHCKATKRDKKTKQALKPGVRVDDCYEVLGQVVRTRTWIRSPSLLSEFQSRVEGTSRSTAIVHGTLQQLKSAAKAFSSNQWEYEVIAVQPGLSCSKATGNKRVNSLLVSTSEWLAGCEATFTVWGS